MLRLSSARNAANPDDKLSELEKAIAPANIRQFWSIANQLTAQS